MGKKRTSREAETVDADDRVGFGHPPRHSQFQPGTSGNPAGRPRGVQTVGDVVRKTLNQKVSISEGGRIRHVSKLEAIFARAVNDAARGDVRALRLIVSLSERYAQSGPVEAELETAASDLLILRRFLPNFDKSSQVNPDKGGDNEPT
jgi:hypothetical protein